MRQTIRIEHLRQALDYAAEHADTSNEIFLVSMIVRELAHWSKVPADQLCSKSYVLGDF